MNKYQRLTLYAVAWFLAIAVIRPPFEYIGTTASRYVGHYPLWNAPRMMTVDITFLMLQMFAILAIGGVMVLAFKNRIEEEDKSHTKFSFGLVLFVFIVSSVLMGLGWKSNTRKFSIQTSVTPSASEQPSGKKTMTREQRFDPARIKRIMDEETGVVPKN